ncbi:hypothetical protein [Hyphobacterium indicum]|uniref:hypothetical protein n=1 Tax=Hyphobacterium indicum TaxID=2162714 RepID=UPI000D64432B|nr:hypothetical protein [Hyphobacterium indicum]
MNRLASKGCAALVFLLVLPVMAKAQDAEPGLPPQDLPAGECGAFFWDRAEPNPLRLFENESRGQARLWRAGEILELGTTARSGPYAAGQRVSRAYRLPSGEVISIEGEITAAREGEAVIGRALLRRTLPGGAEEVSPLMGLISCREAADR